MPAYRPDPAPDALQAKVLATRQELAAALIERDDEVDLVLTPLVAQEHPLLVGPPGTAKSLLLDSLMAWMQGAKFTVLFTKYTTPEEVFGPVSLAGLKADRFVRVTAGKLPEALHGAGRVEPEHLEILQHVLWDAPEEQPARVAQVVAKVANPAGMKVSQLLLEAEAVLAAADVPQLAQAATATAKLGEIDKQLAALGTHPRAARARAYVKDHVKRIKLASIEAI
jgi:hypothetical protein